MSDVTNIILSFSIVEKTIKSFGKEEYLNVISVNTWLYARKYGNIGENAYSGGNKEIETALFFAAFNHFNSQVFLQFLKSLPWIAPEEVQMMVKGQHDEKFTMIDVFPDVKLKQE